MPVALLGGYREALDVVFKTPELLAVVIADEVGIVAEELGEKGVLIVGRRGVIVGEVTRSAARRLNHRPNAGLGTCAQPRLRGLIAVFDAGKLLLFLVPVDGHRDVEDDIGANVLGDKLDDSLGVGFVPAVDMYNPHRHVRGDRSSQRCFRRCLAGSRRRKRKRRQKRHRRQKRRKNPRYNVPHKSTSVLRPRRSNNSYIISPGCRKIHCSSTALII